MQEGTQLEHYRIVDKLGEGGMGQVFRAEDTKLRREVAIKVLPEVVANDPDRLARFEREAHLLAALNHGNIASIYGLEEADGIRFLVMELVPGENLEQRLGSGPIEMRRALEIGRSVADALEDAHGKGIIHRDLKPANVMVTPDGKVKVLDLGLAKALVGDAGDGSAPDVSMSPTIAVAGTAAGVILGTAAYMSPEQARGKELDARTDIWSFGCLLFELITGRRTFTGETVSDLTASILKEEPDWSALPAETPMGVRQLLARCLQKDSRRRLQAIGDARIELDDALRAIDNVADGTLPSGFSTASAAGVSVASSSFSAAPAAGSAAPTERRGVSVVALAGVGLLAAALGALAATVAMRPEPAPERPLTRLAIPVGDLIADRVSISRDGREVVISALDPETDEWAMYRRAMNSGTLQRIAGSEGTDFPQLAGNDQVLLSGVANALVRLPIAGGTPAVVTSDTSNIPAHTMLDDGRIVYGDARRGLSMLPPGGGEAVRLVEPDASAEERALTSPTGLPGGTHILYVANHGGGSRVVMALELATGAKQEVLRDALSPRYVPSGHIMFMREGAAWAVEFDADTLTTHGDPTLVVDGVMWPDGSPGVWDVSDDGTLIFQEGETSTFQMELVVLGSDEDRDEGDVIIGGDQYEWPSFSPDGRFLAAAIHGTDQHGVWSYDVERGTRIRLSFVGNDGHPIWSPDGSQVVFYSGTANGGDLYMVAADGSDGETATRLTESSVGKVPRSFSPDGRYLIYTHVTEETLSDVIAMDVETREETPLLTSSFNEGWGMVSPDGEWLAYTSDETGTNEVYLRPFMREGPKIPVSSGGGDVPTWSSDGASLYYRDAGTLLRVGFEGGDAGRLGAPTRVREDIGQFYYPVPGSDQILTSRSMGDERVVPDHLVVIPNVFDEIRRRLGQQ